jgi:hypothetical protein
MLILIKARIEETVFSCAQPYYLSDCPEVLQSNEEWRQNGVVNRSAAYILLS